MTNISDIEIVAISLSILVVSLLGPAKSYAQPKLSLDVSMMSKADAHKAKWTLRCALKEDYSISLNRDHLKFRFLCGVEFARTIEKYTREYKDVIKIENEQTTPKDIIDEHFLVLSLDELRSRQFVKSIIDRPLKKLYVDGINIAIAFYQKCYEKYEQNPQKYKDCVKRNDPLHQLEKLYKKTQENLGPLRIYKKQELREYKPKEVKILSGDE